MKDYELELDGKKMILPVGMTQPKVDISGLPDAEIKKPRLRRKKPTRECLPTIPPNIEELLHDQETKWAAQPTDIMQTITGIAGSTTQAPQVPNWTALVGMGVGAIASALFSKLK